MQYDLGCFDNETCRLEPIDNPFGPKVFTYVLGMNCQPCDRNEPSEVGSPYWTISRNWLIRETSSS